MEADDAPFTHFLCQCSIVRVFKATATQTKEKSEQTLESLRIKLGTSSPEGNALTNCATHLLLSFLSGSVFTLITRTKGTCFRYWFLELLLHLTDRIMEAMDGKNLIALVLLDLSEAFDSIQHRKLLLKLSRLGASPSTVNWCRSYLSGRSQFVRIASILSDPQPITHGIPQGAIISPLLFCI